MLKVKLKVSRSKIFRGGHFLATGKKNKSDFFFYISNTDYLKFIPLLNLLKYLSLLSINLINLA